MNLDKEAPRATLDLWDLEGLQEKLVERERRAPRDFQGPQALRVPVSLAHQAEKASRDSQERLAPAV